MTTVRKSVQTTRRHRYEVPAPACWSDVLMALKMALRDYAVHHGLPEDSEPSDDAVQVLPLDESVLVFWDEVPA